MASKKIKMEKDDDNNDQESKPTNSAAQQQLVAPTRPLHQLQPRSGSLMQPGLSAKPVIDRAAANKILKDFDSLKLSEVSSSPPSLKLHPFDVYVNESGSVTVSPDAGTGVGSLKRSRSNLADILHSSASQNGENKGDSDNAKVPSEINAEINLRQKRRKESEENMQKLIPSVDPLPSTGIVINEGGGSTSSNVLLSGAHDGDENKDDSDKAKPPFVPLAQGTGSGPGSNSGHTTACDESNRSVSTAAGEVLSATDTDMSESTTESDEIQGDKEKSDAS